MMKKSSYSQIKKVKKTPKKKINISINFSFSSLLFFKKIKRYTKQGIKNILLSSSFYTFCKTTSLLFFLFFIGFGFYSFVNKTFANEVVVSQGEIIDRVGKLIDIPKDNPDQIVRIQDSEELKKQNSFYSNAKEGDYIILYKNMAIIYDLRLNEIVSVRKLDH